MSRVHDHLQHPGAGADQVEGEGVRGVGQDHGQAGGQTWGGVTEVDRRGRQVHETRVSASSGCLQHENINNHEWIDINN